MSTSSSTGTVKPPEHYTQGSDRYIEFIRDFFDIDPTVVQRRLLRAVADHKRTIAIGANGPGKSFIAAMLNGAFLYTNTDSICMPTSGTYSVLDDTLWKPLKARVKYAQDTHALPGRCIENPPRILIDDEWFFKAASPTHPENLEGRHAGTMLITIEEADKPDITREHIDSAESMITDDQDRMLVIANPPQDESNVVYDLMQDDNWHTIQFSSFESRNVRIDMGELEGEKTPGLVDLETVRYDWERWNRSDWPGAETARRAHEERDDLDTRWYRRRAGVMPPDNASAHRPFYVEDVREATENPVPANPGKPVAVGIDVARRGGDSTVVATLYPETVACTTWTSTDHNENESRIQRVLDDLPNDPRIAIDAVGEGSGLADRLTTRYPHITRFKAGEKAIQEDEYYNRWSEGLARLGTRLPGLAIEDGDANLREELFAAARHVEFEEKRRRSGDVLKATSKEDLKEHLERSPDTLDAVMMATWAADAYTPTRHKTRRRAGGVGRRQIRR